MSTPVTIERDRSFDTTYHAPVLVHEIVDVLRGRARVLDCTLGGGGHTMALLASGSRVTGIDRDPQAIQTTMQRVSDGPGADRFEAILGDFTQVDQIPAVAQRRFDGILADLGVSSHQIDDAARGFSFRPGAPLDMRMSRSGLTAADLLNQAQQDTLADLFHRYGDEPKARRLASEIIRRRANAAFVVSDDLVNAIRGVLGRGSGPGDFARLFQAVRIAVNDELAGLERALPILRDRLVDGGVLAIIAYHSGEDRLVKHAMRDWSIACHCPPRQPLCTCHGRALGTVLTRKAIVPSDVEVARNPRARSAKLRLWQKTA